MTSVKVPQPISGGLLLSYKCSAECLYCMYLCSSKWEAEWLNGSRQGGDEWNRNRTHRV